MTSYKRTNVWTTLNEVQRRDLDTYSKRYMAFLDAGKTEREAAAVIIDRARQQGYISLEDGLKSGNLTPGTKLYANNKDKAVALIVLGEDLESGMQIVGAHIDAPRLDLKAVPLYEEGNLAFFKTHYYGGIKKYQWTAIPLAIHGVVYTKSGEKITLAIGEAPEDPVFFINDLLPHLAKDQMAKTMGEGITGEQLNVVVGHDPSGNDDEVKDPIKANILKYLHETYGMDEEDFIVSEIEVVPAQKAREVGFDRSLIAAYGHDDRVCSYAALEAILEVDAPKRTAVALFVDKEEIGSVGNTGMTSKFFENAIAELFSAMGDYSDLKVRRAMARSKVLSADVNVSFDPNFADTTEKQNVAHMGCGITLSKYTGSRGKSGSNDGNAEFLQEIRQLFNANGIIWQPGELGKVDQGGGGSIAYILAEYGAEVVDCGTGMLSMHAPVELVSKADAYMTYKAYSAFLK